MIAQKQQENYIENFINYKIYQQDTPEGKTKLPLGVYLMVIFRIQGRLRHFVLIKLKGKKKHELYGRIQKMV